MTDEIARHESEFHSRRFDTGEVDRMIAEHEELVETLPEIRRLVRFMVADLYGKPVKTVAHPEGDPDVRRGGRFERYDSAVDKVTNGGIRVQLPAWLVAIIVASIGLLGTITAALIVAAQS